MSLEAPFTNGSGSIRRRAAAGTVRAFVDGALVSVAGGLALRRLDDSDTWWHLASGRWIAENGRVPATDPFSYTVPHHRWVNLQWLYDLILYGLYQLGGPDLLVLGAAAAYATAVWLLLRNVRLSLGGAAAGWLALAAVLVVEERFFIRPEMVSFILLEALLWLLLTAGRSEGRHLWMLAPLILLWANAHALFVVGLFCIGAAVISALAARLHFLPEGWRAASRLDRGTERRLLLWSAVAFITPVLNPYGIAGALFPIRLLSRIDPNDPVFQSIAEFRPPFSGFVPSIGVTVYQVLFVAALLAVTLAAAVSARKAPAVPGVDLATLLMFCGVAYLSLLARRNMAIFALGATPLVARCLAVLGARLPRAVKATLGRASALLSALLLLACAGLVVAVAGNWYYRFGGLPHEFGLGVLEASFPIRAAELARRMKLPPRLYNDLTAGGYLAWARPVRGGVFIDGRLEVYEREFFSTYIDGLLDPAAWKREADRFGIRSALIFHRWSSRRKLVLALLRDPDWALVYHDEVALLFVRRKGNEALVEAARARFAEEYGRSLAALRAVRPGWRWPAGAVEALDGYAKLHFLLGNGAIGTELSERLLALGLPARREASVRYRVAEHLARIGRTAEAREQLAIASGRDPGNASVARLLADLGG